MPVANEPALVGAKHTNDRVKVPIDCDLRIDEDALILSAEVSPAGFRQRDHSSDETDAGEPMASFLEPAFERTFCARIFIAAASKAVNTIKNMRVKSIRK